MKILDGNGEWNKEVIEVRRFGLKKDPEGRAALSPDTNSYAPSGRQLMKSIRAADEDKSRKAWALRVGSATTKP